MPASADATRKKRMRILTLSMALVLALTGAAQAGSKKEIEKRFTNRSLSTP